jgi:hypothetical protein
MWSGLQGKKGLPVCRSCFQSGVELHLHGAVNGDECNCQARGVRHCRELCICIIRRRSRRKRRKLTPAAAAVVEISATKI